MELQCQKIDSLMEASGHLRAPRVGTRRLVSSSVSSPWLKVCLASIRVPIALTELRYQLRVAISGPGGPDSLLIVPSRSLEAQTELRHLLGSRMSSPALGRGDVGVMTSQFCNCVLGDSSEQQLPPTPRGTHSCTKRGAGCRIGHRHVGAQVLRIQPLQHGCQDVESEQAAAACAR